MITTMIGITLSRFDEIMFLLILPETILFSVFYIIGKINKIKTRKILARVFINLNNNRDYYNRTVEVLLFNYSKLDFEKNQVDVCVYRNTTSSLYDSDGKTVADIILERLQQFFEIFI